MSLKKQYRDLEMQVLRQLRELIEKSNHISKHHSEKAIRVNVFDYTELTIIDGRLTFMDAKGYHYSIFADASLEDLIDIINLTNL